MNSSSEQDLRNGLVQSRPLMRRFAIGLVGIDGADDLIQDASERAWQKRLTFDPARGSVQAWLLAIVADKARQRWRRREPIWEQIDPEALILETTPSASVDVLHHIRMLPARQRAAVLMFYFMDLSVADTASLMECAEGTVKSTLADARKALQRSLGDDYARC